MSDKAVLYDVIRKPIITEKATMASEAGAVVFEVAIDSNKPQIKEAVENLFGVKVKAVNTLITKGKTKRFRGKRCKRKNVKKTYVTIEESNTIAGSPVLITPSTTTCSSYPGISISTSFVQENKTSKAAKKYNLFFILKFKVPSHTWYYRK